MIVAKKGESEKNVKRATKREVDIVKERDRKGEEYGERGGK